MGGVKQPYGSLPFPLPPLPLSPSFPPEAAGCCAKVGVLTSLRRCGKLPAGVERENFKIDCRSLFGVGPADIMHVERNVRLRYVCIRLT